MQKTVENPQLQFLVPKARQRRKLEMPQFQFLNKLTDVPVISQTSSGDGDFWRPRRLTVVSRRGLGVALTPGVSPRC